MRSRVLIAALISSVIAGIPAVGTAQVPDTAAARRLIEQRTGRQVTQQEILSQLQSSGLSRSQVRTQLQGMGLDPSLADYYFDLAEQGRTAPNQAASLEMVQALQRMGVAVQTPYGDPFGNQQLQLGPDSTRTDSLPAPARADSAGLPVFGRDFFQRPLGAMQAPRSGPVDPDYRIGPGDQLGLVLSGDVEVSYVMEVAREGYIVLPDVGQIYVNGLTLKELEDLLYARLGQVYSGVREGPEATTRLQVSLGRLRTSLVYVMGEVETPGALQVGALSTVFHALYEAGGPSEHGSFRDIQVRRGGRVIAHFDLYDYLLTGDSRNDVRLQQGDIVFVPVEGFHVSIRGAVRRQAIFEVRDGESLRDVVRFAGGWQADAVVRRVQIDRIVPPDERRPGIDRVLHDVDVRGLLASDGPPVPVHDGDAIRVFAVSDARRHRVSLEGEVHRPGVYEWYDGMTLWDLISRAEGLDEAAYTPRAHIHRLNERDGTRRLIRTPLLADSAGRPDQDVALADRDSVVILSRERLINTAVVHIAGFVKQPGAYPLSEGMTVRDLILTAGGFAYGAARDTVEVARMPDSEVRTDTVARVFRIALGTAPAAPGEEDVPDWIPSDDEFRLVRDDRVFVRKAAGFEELKSIKVTGEIMAPGVHVLGSRKTRLTDVIRQAGGLTAEAHVPGVQLYRAGDLVAVNLERALADPDSRFNFTVEDGDSLYVPKYDPTVQVKGAVAFESRVPYVEGAGLDYYIAQAGGYTDVANRNRVSVTYQNGQRAIVRELLVFRRKPEPGPGSRINVPEVPAAQRRPFDVVAFVTATLPALTTLLLALAQLR